MIGLNKVLKKKGYQMWYNGRNIMENLKLYKKTLSLPLIVCLMILSIISVRGVATQASCMIKLGNPEKVESDSIGLSKSAFFEATSYGDSFGPANVICYAAWAGWPYTNEGNMWVPAGKYGSLTVTQRKDSNFYMTIWATAIAGTHAYGKVTLK